MLDAIDRIRMNATKCRDLADTAMTSAARDILAELAEHYEQEAVSLESLPVRRRQRRPAFSWARA
ncbi:MAG: hypothetical protein JO335_00785 [Sphingomonas sp.]|nr:hypothetical protein [Sphingomonas sp.]